MYRVIIVDDEDIIRQGIVDSVPWSELGFEVAGSAANGLEALDKIRELKPDVVLTDIRMPKMDGIELIEHFSSEFPGIKSIILSGYSEVEYLKQAIKNKVTDYLLKPTDYEEFERVFKNVRDALDQERQKQDEHERLKKQLLESLPYMRERFLNQLVKGYYNDINDIEEKLRFYEVELSGGSLSVMVLEIDNGSILLKEFSEGRKQLLRLSLVHLANAVTCESRLGTFFPGERDEIIGICCIGPDVRALTSIAAEIQKKISDNKMLTVSVGISSECSDIRRINQYYRQAQEAIRQKVFLGNESIVFYRDIENASGGDLIYCMFDSQSILNSIFYGSGAGLEELVNQVFVQFESKLLKNSEYLDNMCLELLFQVSRQIQQYGLRLEDILQSKGISLFDIYRLDNLCAKKAWLIDILNETGARIRDLRGDSNNRIIEEVKAFVRENFSNNTMSLDFAADKVNKNTAYLSKLFKSQTGENFIDYLTRQRMEKAKELLDNVGLKTYEISSMVGYADVSHFTKVFKKYAGLSPSEYRERHGKANDGK